MLRKTLEINKYKNRDINNEYHDEYQYLNLLNDIMNEGSMEEGRNGFTKSVFGTAMHFSLENNKIPILTTKKTAWKTCLKELLWFIRGQTDNNILNEQNVHIWDGNSSREFLDNNNLEQYEVNELGPIYSHQWRNFNGIYFPNKDKKNLEDIYQFKTNGTMQENLSCGKYCNHTKEELENNIGLSNDVIDIVDDVKILSPLEPKKGIDQLQNVINDLKDPNKRNSRRHIVCAWNPSQLHQMALPPCHVLFQFNVINKTKLSCSVYCRSQDCTLGTPFNISSYSFLTHLIAKHCDLEPYEFILYGGNCHIYDDHFEQVKEQLKREPLEFPTLQILNKKDNINDYDINDFKISNYKHHTQIKAKMRA